jgi:uncharacterized membrane-anchored protein YhcB (DUF1043 family)
MNGPTPEPNAFLQFWIIILFVAQIISLIVGIVVASANRKQRREVSFTETPASKKDFDQHVVETARNFNAVRNELAHDRQLNQEHASKRSETLFRKMDTTRSELDTKIEDTRRELSEKIDAMPERVIATLKNTGAI